MDARPPLTIDELAGRIAASTGMDTPRVTAALRALFAAAADRLADANGSGRVELPGTGTFVSDPGGGVSFVPDASFAEAVNEPFAMFEPIELADETDIAIASDAPTAPSAPAETAGEAAEHPDAAVAPSMTGPTVQPETSCPPDAEEADAEANAETATDSGNPDAEASAATGAPLPDTALHGVTTAAPHTRPRAYRLGWMAVGLVIGIIIGYLAGALTYSRRTAPQGEITAAAPTAETADPTDTIVVEESEAAGTPSAAPAETAMTTDTVTTRRYITHMAKDYYGDRIFWVYIYEANAEALGHPERTLPGTVVRIPSAETVPADPSDPDDIRRARALAAEIYSRFR